MTQKTAVILVNLGTPDAADTSSVRRYLREFLSDRRVIEKCPFLWQIILNLFILPFRPTKTAKVYQSVWRHDTNESPLRYFTRQQAQKLQDLLGSPDLEITWAMRYGNPSIKSVMEDLQARGFQQLVVVPLYPQYAASTTATVNDAVCRVLLKMRWQPALRLVGAYETHPSYIAALRTSIQNHLQTLDWTPERLLVSFHGIPLEYVTKGDPYKDYCIRTFHALKASLPKGSPELMLTFQSRFGPKEWLQPYTDKTLEALGQEGIKKLAVIAPGFAADCIETLEELSMEGQEIFTHQGGTHFTVIPCLNDSPESIDLLKDLILENIAGWHQRAA